MHAPRFLLLLLSTFLAIRAALGAAPPAGSRTGWEVSARYSHAAASDLEAPWPAGVVRVDSLQLDLRAQTPLTNSTRLLYGVDWRRHELDLSGPRWLPESLQAVSLPLGVSHALDSRWRLLGTLQPRFAAAGSGLSSSGFDLPVLALANYTARPDLTWSFGLRYGARSDLKVLPLAGVNWKFAPAWEFSLAWPESGWSYRATPQLTLRLAAAFHGGDFHLDDDPRTPATRTGASLSDDWLEYREVRAGFAAEYTLSPAVRVRADVGKVIDQRFEYLDRGPTLKGCNPTYFALALVGRF